MIVIVVDSQIKLEELPGRYRLFDGEVIRFTKVHVEIRRDPPWHWFVLKADYEDTVIKWKIENTRGSLLLNCEPANLGRHC